uniref:Myb-like domain-containing protein n=1 Tax=Araucaria cunninghamii TaxID=56994 RepID=A0A0D6R8P1_ARACU
MEYYDEDPRPRFQVQKSASSLPPKPPNSSDIDKRHVAICAAAGILIFSYGCLLPGILQILLAWIGISLVVGPFAPISLTGGDIRVGTGDPLEEIEDPQIEPPKPEIERKGQRAKSRRSENPNSVIPISNEPRSEDNGYCRVTNESLDENPRISMVTNESSRVSKVFTSEEWSVEEMELLRKQLTKNPPGKPGRWEAVAGAFEGTRTVDCVIKQAKSLAEKRPGDEDSFAKFLAQRKVSDRGLEINGEGVDLAGENDTEKKLGWSSEEDRALLNALKAFPKETNMRWEKIAAAVPGKSKSQCMKRLSELKQNFRNSKASES